MTIRTRRFFIAAHHITSPRWTPRWPGSWGRFDSSPAARARARGAPGLGLHGEVLKQWPDWRWRGFVPLAAGLFFGGGTQRQSPTPGDRGGQGWPNRETATHTPGSGQGHGAESPKCIAKGVSHERPPPLSLYASLLAGIGLWMGHATKSCHRCRSTLTIQPYRALNMNVADGPYVMGGEVFMLLLPEHGSCLAQAVADAHRVQFVPTDWSEMKIKMMWALEAEGAAWAGQPVELGRAYRLKHVASNMYLAEVCHCAFFFVLRR